MGAGILDPVEELKKLDKRQKEVRLAGKPKFDEGGDTVGLAHSRGTTQ